MAFFLIITTLLVAAVASVFVRKDTRVLSAIALCASGIELVSTLVIARSIATGTGGSYVVNTYFSIDALGVVIMLILAVVGAIVSWYSISYLHVEVAQESIGFRRVRQYFVLLHLFLLAMFFAIATTSPILMWVAIEATTLSTAFLISFYNKPSAIEAAWKYLMINSVGLLIGFFGTLLFLYPSMHAGDAGLVSWTTLLRNANAFDPNIVKIAFLFVLIGYGTKVGLAPMHTWLPDAHSKAPAPISGLLSGVLLNVAFLALLRFKSVIDIAIGSLFSQTLFLFFGALSLMIAAFIIFGQKNYKRLLAYSSIEHMAIATIGFGFGGIGAFAALLHMIYHALTKSLLFLTSGNLLLKYHSTKISNVTGAISVVPVTAVIFIIGVLAITGVPPFGVFVTEFTILSAGMRDHLAVVLVMLFALALIFAGFLRHTVAMVFSKPNEKIKPGESGVGTIAPLVVLIVLLVSLSLFIPSTLQSLLTLATAIY